MRFGSCSKSNLDRYIIISEEIEILTEMIQPTATGHIRTAISVLEMRLSDIFNELTPEEKTWLAIQKKF